eukprot:scaffold46606_cov77-Phaeocystis_antarctica.AAC.2
MARPLMYPVRHMNMNALPRVVLICKTVTPAAAASAAVERVRALYNSSGGVRGSARSAVRSAPHRPIRRRAAS